MSLTLSHWIYALITLAVIGTMLFRRGVVILTLVGTFLIGWVYKGSIISGFQAIFNANLIAAKELFTIFLIITFMVALLSALRDIGADRRMIIPTQKVMINGHVAFFVLAGITFGISLFFWPTPAVPLIGALLIPAAVRAGLPAMGVGMAIAMAGQGMALSSDYIMQIAPMLSAKGAGVDTALVADKAMVLSLITGGISLGGAYLMNRCSPSGDGSVDLGRYRSNGCGLGWRRNLYCLVLISRCCWLRWSLFVGISTEKLLSCHDRFNPSNDFRCPHLVVYMKGSLSKRKVLFFYIKFEDAEECSGMQRNPSTDDSYLFWYYIIIIPSNQAVIDFNRWKGIV